MGNGTKLILNYCQAFSERAYIEIEGCNMNSGENNQYFSVNNGRYYVKRTIEDNFYILTDFNEWEYNPSLAREFYDVLSGYVEITEEAMNEIIGITKEP